jgi:hypothetical protein
VTNYRLQNISLADERSAAVDATKANYLLLCDTARGLVAASLFGSRSGPQLSEATNENAMVRQGIVSEG